MPVPEHPESYMNKAQLRALNQVEHFGVGLVFIRHQDATVVLKSFEGDIIGVL